MRAATARFSVAAVKRYVWLLDPVTGLVIATSGLLQLWRDPAGGSFHGPTWANSTWMVVLAAVVVVQKASLFGGRSPRVLAAGLTIAAVTVWVI